MYKCNLEICLNDFSNEAFYYRDIHLAQFVEACMHDQTRVPNSGLLGREKFSGIAFPNSAIQGHHFNFFLGAKFY